jgi:hypothetical protein
MATGKPGEKCPASLMEDSWEEGFDCSLEPGHEGPHRDMTDWNARNESTDVSGRAYRWAYEWEWTGIVEALT